MTSTVIDKYGVKRIVPDEKELHRQQDQILKSQHQKHDYNQTKGCDAQE